MRELNTKQVCVLAFIVSDKVYIITIITSDISGIIIVININLFDTMNIPLTCTQDYG